MKSNRFYRKYLAGNLKHSRRKKSFLGRKIKKKREKK
jgi:hypothetical protein